MEYCPYRQLIHVNGIELMPRSDWLYNRHNEWHYLSIVFNNGNIKRYWDRKYQSEMTIDIPKNINSIQVGNFEASHGSNSNYYKDIAIDDLILVTNNTEISTELPTMYKGDSSCVFLDIDNYIFGTINEVI